MLSLEGFEFHPPVIVETEESHGAVPTQDVAMSDGPLSDEPVARALTEEATPATVQSSEDQSRPRDPPVPGLV